jgi:hypothetical protein
MWGVNSTKSRIAWLSDNGTIIGCLLTIILVNWIGNFWNFFHFGFYVDDYSRIPQVMDTAYDGLFDRLAYVFTADLSIRPIHNYLINSLSLLGNAIGGLPVIYLLGYLISSANAVLFFFLLRQVLDHPLFPLTGALAFCLYPVSTIKIWLTSLLGIQPALTLLLVALLCYSSNRKILSYILMSISLFCYESVFPVFMAAPLLKRIWNRALLYELSKHLLLLSAIFISFFILKVSSNDPRVTDLDFVTVLQSAIHNLIAGPFINIKWHLAISVKNLVNLPPQLILLQIGSIITFWLIFYKINGRIQSNHEVGGLGNSQDSVIDERSGGKYILLVSPVLSALLMLVLGYAMSFYGSVYSWTGIGSRIHSTAVPGVALFTATVAIGLLYLFSEIKKAFIALCLMALLFSSYFTYNFRIQQEYIDSRNLQRRFWSEVIALCPDITDGSLILVEPSGFSKTPAIGSLTWSTSRILDKIYKFPQIWRYVPRVYLITNRKKKHALPISEITTARSVAELSRFGVIPFLEPSDVDRPIRLDNTIVLTSQGGSLHRQTVLYSAENEKVALKANSNDTVHGFDKGVLHGHLITNGRNP